MFAGYSSLLQKYVVKEGVSMLEDYLKNDEFTYQDFIGFVDKKGLANVTRDDLNAVIDKFGMEVFTICNFDNVYNMKLADETNLSMTMWTKRIGLMTIAMSVFAGVTLIFTILTYLTTLK